MLAFSPVTCRPSLNPTSFSCVHVHAARIARFLRCYKNSIPAALAAAFGEDSPASAPQPASMEPPPPQSPQVWPSSIWSGSAGSATTSRSSAARTPGEVPSWLTTVLGSTSSASPATPLLVSASRRHVKCWPWRWWHDERDTETYHKDYLCVLPTFLHAVAPSRCRCPPVLLLCCTAVVATGLLQRRSAWTDESSDAESSEKRWHRERGSLWSFGTPGSSGKENTFPSSSSTCSSSPASVSSGGSDYTTTPSSSARQQGPSKSARRVAAHVRDGPAATLCLASLPACGCLHQGKVKTWVPGGLKTWQASSRRGRTAEARERAGVGVTCPACSSAPEAASAFSVQVSEDGRLIVVASRNRTVTVFDAQSREVVYRFGHPKLSTRARPILVEGGSGGGSGGWGRGGGGRGDVFCGMMNGEIRCWKVGSQFPNRVFKTAGHHKGFEICCLATSKNGAAFASADLSGTVCVQSASSGQQPQQCGREDGE